MEETPTKGFHVGVTNGPIQTNPTIVSIIKSVIDTTVNKTMVEQAIIPTSILVGQNNMGNLGIPKILSTARDQGKVFDGKKSLCKRLVSLDNKIDQPISEIEINILPQTIL